MRRWIASFAGFAALVAFANVGHAAEFTDLLDAADDYDDLIEETFDPFDFSLEPRFGMEFESATIAREAACVPSESDLVGEAAQNNPRVVVDRGRCSEARTIANSEMEYSGSKFRLDIDLRAGIYKDLEFKLNVPYVFSQTRGLRYAGGVNPTNSSVDPSDEVVRGAAASAFDPAGDDAQHAQDLETFTGYRYFDLSDSYSEYSRSGFADPSIQIEWAPFNDERDDTKATLLLGMNYRMPISPVQDYDNEAVGEGVHRLSWRLAASKRFAWIEPYFGLNYILPFAATDSPIRKIDSNNNGQVFATPPQTGKMTVGTEFIPYENPAKGQRYAIDFRFTFGYTSEGRDYTPLYDHMVNSGCNGKTLDDVLPDFDGAGELTNVDDVACSWVVREPSNAQPVPIYDLGAAIGDDSPWEADGIMTVEGYGTFEGMVGAYLQPTQYFQFKAQAFLEAKQEHFLTNARTGRDTDNESTPDDTVDLEGPDAQFEKNPVYNAAYDQPGNRFRVQGFTTWKILLTAALQF